MKINNLRSLIRESINEYISEINAAGDKAACEAKITATQNAIDLRKKKMAMEGLDEAYHDMLDKGKMKELSGEIKALENNLKKLQKQLDKLNSKSEPKTEVVADAMTEEAPIDETDVMAEMEIAEESTEEALNESFLKMQKLAGVITESQYNQKIQMLDEDLRAGVYNDFIKWKESFKDETEFPQENGYVVAKKDGQEVGKWNPISKLGMHANDAQYKTL